MRESTAIWVSYTVRALPYGLVIGYYTVRALPYRLVIGYYAVRAGANFRKMIFDDDIYDDGCSL